MHHPPDTPAAEAAAPFKRRRRNPAPEYRPDDPLVTAIRSGAGDGEGPIHPVARRSIGPAPGAVLRLAPLPALAPERAARRGGRHPEPQVPHHLTRNRWRSREAEAGG